MRQAKQTLKELMAGLAVWGGFVFVILMIVSRHRLAVACGLLVGLGTAVAYMAYVPSFGHRP